MSFEIIVCEDKIPLPYHHMKIDKNTKEMCVDPQVLCDIITHRYNDRVLPNYGLLIDLYDIVKAYDCKSIPDVPVAYARTVFRYIVFNPPIGSVWRACIDELNSDGMYLRMSFFHNIWIPWANLPEGTEFKDNAWVWSDSTDEDNQYAYLAGEDVRFKVCEVKYNTNAKDGRIMTIVGSMATNGLGPVGWWEINDEEGDENPPQDP
jgi:DNA-directed RNA polymerase III subunit RPC8